ncbi:ataxin-1 [Schistosoma japonicum]|uniref:Ataxin-1 n=1 Tax=Schistosoma japonicum TaxID=6182 RepID=A0A4Z2DCM6_SCHJA|nr:ataxin-1 [Schistosoma japonicum]
MHSSACQNMTIPNPKELFSFSVENDNAYLNNSACIKQTDKITQIHQDNEMSFTNLSQNPNNCTNNYLKSDYCPNQYDNTLYTNLKVTNTPTSANDILSLLSSVPPSSTSFATALPFPSSSLLWLNCLSELFSENPRELTTSSFIYKTLTNLLCGKPVSHIISDDNESILNTLNNYHNVTNIQNQSKGHSYLHDKFYSCHDESKNCALATGLSKISENTTYAPSDISLHKLWNDDKALNYNSQISNICNMNCKTNRERHHVDSNYTPSFLPPHIFPFFNSFIKNKLIEENAKELNCSDDKKCSIRLKKMSTTDHLQYNLTRNSDNLLNTKSTTHVSDTPLTFNDGKSPYLNGPRNTEHLKPKNKCNLNKYVRLINGDIKVKEDLSVSDFIASAIKYEDFNKSTCDNGELIETLASTNNLEICWVKLFQIKRNLNTPNSLSEVTFIHSSKRHHLLVGRNEKNGSKQASRMLWPHFNAKSFNVDRKLVLNVTNDYPFFVYGHGWSSIDPNLTCKQQELNCRQLQEDDICLVLTYCVHSTGRKYRFSTNKSCSYKTYLSDQNHPVNCKLQPTSKSVPFITYDEMSHSLPITSSERKFDCEFDAQLDDNQKIPVNLKIDPHYHSSTMSYFVDKDIKQKQYDCNKPVMKRPKLELPYQRVIKSNTLMSHPFSACNLAKSPEDL